MRRPSNTQEVAGELGCNSRLSKSGIYSLRRHGIIRRRDDGRYEPVSRVTLCIFRKRGWFVTVIGGSLVVAKAARTRVRAYVLSIHQVISEGDKQASYRVRIASSLLDDSEAYCGCENKRLWDYVLNKSASFDGDRGGGRVVNRG